MKQRQNQVKKAWLTAMLSDGQEIFKRIDIKKCAKVIVKDNELKGTGIVKIKIQKGAYEITANN